MLLEHFVADCKELVMQRRRWCAQLEQARALAATYQATLTNLTVAHYSGNLERDEHLRAKEATEHLLRDAQAAAHRAEEDAAALQGSPHAALADALLEFTAPLGRTRSTKGADEAVREAIKAAVRAVLGPPTRAELEQLDLEGRRRHVRQVVECVRCSRR